MTDPLAGPVGAEGPVDLGPEIEFIVELGRGSRSMVYRVRHRGGGHDGEYAVKLLRDSDADRAEMVAFRREAALLACLDHPGVTRIHEVGEAVGRPYLIMELVSGESLSQALVAGPLPESVAVDLIRQVADVLVLRRVSSSGV